jgi:hypothetical protein
MAEIKNTIKNNLALALLFFGFVCSAQTRTDSIKVNFAKAKNEIENMLLGIVPLDYERAVFITENAYYENTLNYADFQYAVNFHLENIKIISQKMLQVNNIITKPNILISKDSASKNIRSISDNLAIYKYMTDTTYFVFDSMQYFHPKFQYSFSDPFATFNWENSQTTTLLDFDKHYGNCNALTSLFKIFSLRLNSNAILCTAPNHIFVRHANENGIFYNIELASKAFPGTGSIETISYTSDEAARSGIAMRELTLKQSICLQLINLAKGYEHKLNNKSDNFILDCAELCLKYDNLNLNAMLLNAEFLNGKIVQSNKSILQLQNSSDFISYQKQITSLYSLGYREMPLEMKNKLLAALMQDTSYISFSEDKTYNPFAKSYRNYNRSYSLSNGLFEEVNTTKPKEQYFNTVFDTKTKRIVEFNKTQPLYNKYDFDPVLFALSIDPLAAKMPYYSPYSAFGNNPILYVDNDGRENIVYLVYLPSKDSKITKQDAQDMANQANANFKNLGLNTRVVVVDNSKQFDAGKIDKTDAVAAIGTASNVKSYITKQGGGEFLNGWTGGDEPERSQNEKQFDSKGEVKSYGGGKFIAIDGNAVESYGAANGWAKTEAGGQIINHGAGHNSDADLKLGHNETGIMMDGRDRQYSADKSDKNYSAITSKGKNTNFISHIRQRFGTGQAKDNYLKNGAVVK